MNPVPPWKFGFKPTQAPSSAALFQCRNASNQHRVNNKGLEQKITSILGTKNKPKTSPLYLLVLVMTIFPFLSLDERGSVFPKPAIDMPRPRLGRKTYWHKDKARLAETRNYWGGPFLRACFLRRFEDQKMGLFFVILFCSNVIALRPSRACPEVFYSNFHGLATLEFET